MWPLQEQNEQCQLCELNHYQIPKFVKSNDFRFIIFLYDGTTKIFPLELD